MMSAEATPAAPTGGFADSPVGVPIPFGLLRRVGSLFGDGLAGRIAGQRDQAGPGRMGPRPVQRRRVQINHGNVIAIPQQPLPDGDQLLAIAACGVAFVAALRGPGFVSSKTRAPHPKRCVAKALREAPKRHVAQQSSDPQRTCNSQ
jgi:hypothetical protein